MDFAYEPEYIYTFEEYQDQLHFRDFEANAVVGKVDLTQKLDDMPLESSCFYFKPSKINNKSKVEDEFASIKSLPYLWRTEFWHRKCAEKKFYSKKAQTNQRSAIRTSSIRKKSKIRR